MATDDPVIIFMDDDEARAEKMRKYLPGAIFTKTVPDTLAALASHARVDLLFLDHDLGGKTFVNSQDVDCGMEVVRQLVAEKRNVIMTVVHTMNIPAGIEMVKKLKDAEYWVFRVPFIQIPYDQLGELVKSLKQIKELEKDGR
jgi:CheY-like chemotaxis protein